MLLRAEPRPLVAPHHLGFNTTLVLLRVLLAYADPAAGEMFQHHSGAIEGNVRPPDPTPNPKFQHHSGAIEGWYTGGYRPVTLTFQHHSGAIEGRRTAPEGVAGQRFNTTLVLLRV